MACILYQYSIQSLVFSSLPYENTYFLLIFFIFMLQCRKRYRPIYNNLLVTMSLRHSLYTLGALVIMSGFSLAYAGFSVYISPAPGTYDHPVSVSIRAERSDAKVFYTFKPNGTPMDTYGYTGAIRIVRSTPIDYFAVVSPTDESKIFSGSYTIAYPTEIGFGSGHLAVTATGAIDITVSSTRVAGYDIGGWQIVGQDGTRTIPDGTYVASGSTYTATGFTYQLGVISLRSPDGEEHATLAVDIVPPAPVMPQTPPDTATPSRHEYIPHQSTSHEVVPSSRPAIAPVSVPDIAPSVPVSSATSSGDTSAVSSASVST